MAFGSFSQFQLQRVIIFVLESEMIFADILKRIATLHICQTVTLIYLNNEHISESRTESSITKVLHAEVIILKPNKKNPDNL